MTDPWWYVASKVAVSLLAVLGLLALWVKQ